MARLNVAPTPLTPSPSNGSLDQLASRQPTPSPPMYRSPTAVSPAHRGTSDVEQETPSEVEKVLHAQDQLRVLSPDDEHIPVPTLCVLGAQNVGKSSVLSALMNIELYSAEGTATRGPTLIASRRTRAAFKASVKIVVYNSLTQAAETVDFASDIREQSALAEVLRCAGEEACRANGGERQVRSWETLQTLSSDERSEGSATWAQFTYNVVILSVSGPTCVSVDLTDLPGLKGGDTGLAVEAMVDRYIEKKHNIIMLCIAAGGGDPSSTDRAIQLVMKRDAEGARTIGIITKADRIEPDMDRPSSFVDLILERNEILGTFQPKYSWWPLRALTASEKKSNVSLYDIRRIEEVLFQDIEWQRVQTAAGRRFGLLSTRQKLENLFAQRITDNLTHVNQRLDTLEIENDQWLKANPEVLNTVEMLHRVISKFAKKLFASIEISNHNTVLYELHLGLSTTVDEHLPQFVPFDDADQATNDGEDAAGDNRIFLNQFAERVASTKNRRDPDQLLRDLVIDYLVEYAPKWRVTAIKHVESLWRQVQDLQRAAAQEVCEDNKMLANSIVQHLCVLNHESQASSLMFIDELHRLARASPANIGFVNEDNRKIRRELSDDFNQQYIARTSSNDTVPLVTAEVTTDAERKTLFELQAKISAAVSKNAKDFLVWVGNQAQVKVLDHVEMVSERLREGFGLNILDPQVAKRIAGLMEPDPTIKLERERRVNERKVLANLRAALKNVGP